MSLVAYEKLTSKDREASDSYYEALTCMFQDTHPCLLMPPSLTSHVCNKNMQKPDTKRHATWTSFTPQNVCSSPAKSVASQKDSTNSCEV